MWNAIKRFAWFIFKSPQRKFCGWLSLITDFRGLCAVGFNKGNQKQHIWVCVGVKNRSEALLTHLLPSLAQLKNRERISLSIADLGSTDCDNLEAEIRSIWSGELIYSREEANFSRAFAFNKAIKQKGIGLVMVCDADVSVPQHLIALIDTYVTRRSAWFPVCQWQINPEAKDWKWFSAGTGIFAADPAHLESTGLLDEKYTEWGKEDWDLFFRFYHAGIMPLRTRVQGLYHHWHSPSEPADFKKMF